MLINIRNFFRLASRAIFPRKCIGCKAVDFWICEKCISGVPKSFENPLPWSASVFEYKNRLIRKAVWMIKFSHKYSVLDDLEKTLGENFDAFLEKQKIKQKEVLLVPVPITKRSMVARGYNQSLLISKILSKSQNKTKVEDSILIKTKNHLPQNKIKNRMKRLDNVKNSFHVKNPEKVKGKIIILIDDVVTTGATLKEAKKALTLSGAKKVFGFSIAH